MRPASRQIVRASIALSMLAGCSGALETSGSEQAVAPDAGGATGGDAGPSDPVACDEPTAATASGEHNPGQPCLDCHAPGGEGPPFSLGGTLYRDPGGASVLAGATIRIIDAAGNDVPLLTARNGNFWTTRAVVYPLEASASACPTTRAMIAAIVNGGGNCNTGGCHGPGAARVYLH